MGVGFVIFMAAFIKVCAVHTPSSNPNKPPARPLTLRRQSRQQHQPNTRSMGAPPPYSAAAGSSRGVPPPHGKGRGPRGQKQNKTSGGRRGEQYELSARSQNSNPV